MDHLPLIGGVHRDCELEAVHNPWSGEITSEIGQTSPSMIDEALDASVEGFYALRDLQPYQRADILEKMAIGVAENKALLSDAILREAGKPTCYAEGEVDRCIQTFQRSAEAARDSGQTSIPLNAVEAGHGRTGLVERFPRGPVLAITPFNFPLNLVAHKIGPAIAAGCSFIVKPAEQTPTPALILGRIAQEAGCPPQAVNILPAHRSRAAQLVEDPRPKVLSFTGSDRVGWMLKSQAGKKKVLLELGGNAAAIVHDDANLDLAVPLIVGGAYAYAGQVCISVQRVLIHESRYAEARDRIIDEVSNVATGNPEDPSVTCGPLIHPSAKTRILQWEKEALDAGGKRTFAQPEPDNPSLLSPRIFETVPRHSKLYQEEVFGPVMMLESYSTLAEAIALVNDSRWGLQAGFFGEKLPEVFQAFRQLEVGALFHNDIPTRRVDHMPYGGVKDSGLGREGPTWAMEDYTEPRMLAIRWGT